MNKTILLLAPLTSILLNACSSDNASIPLPEPTPEPPPEITSVPDISAARPIAGGLTQAGEEAVSRFLKNGIYSATANTGLISIAGDAGVPETAPANADRSFSTTNTQEVGVDEADRIEYDGNYMYVAGVPVFDEETGSSNSIRILQRNEDFSLSQVNEIVLPENKINVQGIYQENNRLSVIASESTVYALADVSILPWEPQAPKVSVDIYDTSAPESATNISEISIDGWLLSSRRIGQSLYLVTSYVPSVESLEVGSEEEETQLQNYLTILDTPTAELMPQLSIDGQSQALNTPEDCFIPEQANELDGYAQLVTVIRINLDQPTDFAATCMSAFADSMYSSTNSIYLTSWNWDNDATTLHKISLADSLTYQASGLVPGVVGWGGNASLRMSEYQDYLRVVSSQYNDEEPVHTLSVLSQQGNSLEVVAQLPNEQQPETIGKPGEDVYAVRFFGNRGYVVTFERIDPLYVLDLNDPSAPFIAGSLEIPGFSSYLHPIGDNYLLGVGQDVTLPNNASDPAGSSIIREPAINTGMKVSLFDVTDPTSPREISSLVKEDAYTPVEYDYRALSVLNNDGVYQFAMPIERWGEITGGPSSVYVTSINSLLMTEVDTATGILTEIGEIRAYKAEDSYVYGGDDRSVIHGDSVYYLHGNQVWQSMWQTDAEVDGPY